MASFYSNISSEGNMLPIAYSLNQKLASYPSSEPPNNNVYGSGSQPSVSLSYPNLLPGSSLSTHDHVESKSMGRRGEMMFIPRYSDGNTVIYSKESVNNSEPIPQYHELSLSLGSQEPGFNQYTNSIFCSLLSSDMQSEVQHSENDGLKNNVQYLSFDLAGKVQDTVNKFGHVSNFENLINYKETSFMLSANQAQEAIGTFCNSKYLKAAQDLLGEVVNVHKAFKKSEKGQNFKSFGQDGSTGVDVKRDESNNNGSHDLSPSERHDLQNKTTKLLSMSDEVDRRYKQYFHQMQVIVSSFEMVTGRGAAQPYTALALQTISRQFRSLRDAIKNQIQATQKSLGDQDDNSNNQCVLSRLRYVDQQLRQQKSLQQFGVLRQPWRPQRGLPESAVTVLRAWLFEHFLHPYPKDSEKIVLARQTGLSRGQVANWFINARVRLWKPMIEEMYKEEFGEAKNEPKSSPRHPMTTQEISSFDERENNEYHGISMSEATEHNHQISSNESRPNVISSEEIDTRGAELSYQAGSFQDSEVNFGLTHFPNKQIISEENRVSLALGLQQSEENLHQPKGNDAESSSTSLLDKLEYYYVDPVNNQHRFDNPHLLSDFVA